MWLFHSDNKSPKSNNKKRFRIVSMDTPSSTAPPNMSKPMDNNNNNNDYDMDLLLSQQQPIPIESMVCYQQDPFHPLLSCWQPNCQNPRPDVRHPTVGYGKMMIHKEEYSTWVAHFHCQKCDQQWYGCRYCTARDLSTSFSSSSSSSHRGGGILLRLEDLKKHEKLKCHKKAMKVYQKQHQEYQEYQRRQKEQEQKEEQQALVQIIERLQEQKKMKKNKKQQQLKKQQRKVTFDVPMDTEDDSTFW